MSSQSLLTTQIERQALAPFIVEGEGNDGPLDCRRLAPGLDVAEQLHLLAADQVGRPAFQVRISIDQGRRRQLAVVTARCYLPGMRKTCPG